MGVRAKELPRRIQEIAVEQFDGIEDAHQVENTQKFSEAFERGWGGSKMKSFVVKKLLLLMLVTILLQLNVAADPTYTISGTTLKDVDMHGESVATIPSGVTCIYDGAFEGCSTLQRLTVPASVNQILGAPFIGCANLSVITFVGDQPKITSSENLGYGYVSSACIIRIPSDRIYNVNTTWYGFTVVRYDPEDESDDPEEDPEVIEEPTDNPPVEWTISNGKLTAVNLNGNTDIIIPDTVTRIGYKVFEDCSDLETVVMPDSVTDIDTYAFYNCSGITNITISKGLKSIECSVFRGCSNLRNIVIPENVTTIGWLAFADCSNLTTMNIPDNVTSIDGWAFDDCKSIASVTIGRNVQSIGERVFYGCSSLTNVTVDFDNKWYRSIDGMLLTKDGHQLIQGVNRKDVVIPIGVTGIGSYAFEHCDKLTDVTILNCVTNIGESAFSDSGLTCLMIPNSVTNIGNSAFSSCCYLSDVTLPNNLTQVNASLFSGCKVLTSVEIPNSVTNIGKYAFYYCQDLSQVVIPNSVMSIGGGAFSYCNDMTVVYADKGDVKRVKGLYSWPDNVEFTEFTKPIIRGDISATVTGDEETGFIIMPSEGQVAVAVSTPRGLDASKVIVEVQPTVEQVIPHGAKIKIARDGNDITAFLNVPAADEYGVIDLTKASVKEAIVREAMDPGQGAVIKINAENPSLTTPDTRKGLVYKLREGSTLKVMQDGDSTIGDGQPWSPTITVKGGSSAFYSISVEK